MIRLQPDHATAHSNLGLALGHLGNLEEAVAACRMAIRLEPDDADFHSNLGAILCDSKHDYEGAIAEFRKAIRLKPDDAQAHCNLGHRLRERGDYAASLAELRKGHELGSKQPGWREPSALWVADAERAATLAGRLPAVLRGDDRPKDAAQGAAFAQMAYDLKQFAAAARLWPEALAADPKLGDDREAGHRYNAACATVLAAACAAALAAASHGKDDPPPIDAARAELRQQALDWLQAERDAWAKLLETGKPNARPTVVRTLQHWQKDTDLAGVRDASALAKLPDAEQKAWHALWESVDSLLMKAQGTRP